MIHLYVMSFGEREKERQHVFVCPQDCDFSEFNGDQQDQASLHYPEHSIVKAVHTMIWLHVLKIVVI